MIHIKRSLCRNEEERCVLCCTLCLCVQVEKRVLRVIAGVLVELVVILFLELALASGPQGGSAVNLLNLVLGSCDVVLVVIGVLVIGKINRVCDMVAVLFDQVLNLPSVGIFLALIVQVKHDCGSAAWALGLLYRVLVLAVADPLVCLVLSIGF